MAKDYFEGRTLDSSPAPRKVAPIEIIVVLVVMLLLAAGAQYAYGAPRVGGPQECDLVADMVLVAAALERVKAPDSLRAELMQEIYATPLGGEVGPKWRELMRLAVRFANKAVAAGSPQDLAQAVNNGCKANRGNLDSILGTGLDT